MAIKRTNYTASTLFNDLDSDPESSANPKSKFRARQTVISDKRTFGNPNEGKAKKKSTMNVRTAILYRKGLPTLIEESVSSSSFYGSILSNACAIGHIYLASYRIIVSNGHRSSTPLSASPLVLCMRIQRRLQVQEMFHVLL